MISAVDSSVLLDVILDNSQHCAASLAAMRRARSQGELIVCPVVWAEVRAALREPQMMNDALTSAGFAFDPFDQPCAELAGDLWREYRRRGGKRKFLIPDFLVVAHALVRAGRILSRDRGFLRQYFKDLAVVDPTAKP